jgi:hypothetical protein
VMINKNNVSEKFKNSLYSNKRQVIVVNFNLCENFQNSQFFLIKQLIFHRQQLNSLIARAVFINELEIIQSLVI